MTELARLRPRCVCLPIFTSGTGASTQVLETAAKLWPGALVHLGNCISAARFHLLAAGYAESGGILNLEGETVTVECLSDLARIFPACTALFTCGAQPTLGERILDHGRQIWPRADVIHLGNCLSEVHYYFLRAQIATRGRSALLDVAAQLTTEARAELDALLG